MSIIKVEAEVENISPLTDSILQVILRPNHYVPYQSGQYLQILSVNGLLNYSIANAPLGSHKYELHIRHSPDNIHTQWLLNDIKQQGRVEIELPYGECELSRLSPDKPILFIAGGIGFAPINAMIEQLLSEGTPRAFELFWGARTQSDLYMDEKVLQWQNHVRHFKYFSRVSNTNKKTLLSMVLARHQCDLHDWQIVISGPFDMVFSTRDALVAAGAPPINIYSDAFSFESEPRA